MHLYWLMVIALFLLILIKLFCCSRPHMRVLDVYSLPGRWHSLKYISAIILLSIRKFLAQIYCRTSLKPGYGIRSHSSHAEMDRRQTLSKDPKAFDAVYLNGANRIGWHMIVAISIRPSNVDGLFILKVPGVGMLLSPKLPDTVLHLNDEEEDSFSSEGLKLIPIKAMEAWKFQYEGEMKFSQNPNKKVHVRIEALWKSDIGFFNYDTDMLSTNLAKAMSTEVWTSDYFKSLRDNHQSHYEQFGELKGIAVIDGVDFNINISTMRDHSFGVKREWKAFHRYVLHIFTLADGRRGHAGIVCIPSVFTRLEFGYIYGKDRSLSAVSDIDFELYQHGENGTPPTDYGFTFRTGKEYYEVKVHVEEKTEFFMGLEAEVRVVECLSRYTINDVEGWGATEWLYSNYPSSPTACSPL